MTLAESQRGLPWAGSSGCCAGYQKREEKVFTWDSLYFICSIHVLGSLPKTTCTSFVSACEKHCLNSPLILLFFLSLQQGARAADRPTVTSARCSPCPSQGSRLCRY
jgi:hypothetical protein